MVLDGRHALGISGILPVVPPSVAAERLFSFSKRMGDDRGIRLAVGLVWHSDIFCRAAHWVPSLPCRQDLAKEKFVHIGGDDTGTIHRADDSSCPRLPAARFANAPF